MKIKKIGHCCLLIDTGTSKILTDPGGFTVETHKNVMDINVILITHEHADHLHIESLRQIVANNPEAKIVTNGSVGKLLAEAGVEHEILEGQDSKKFSNTLVEARDEKHAEIYQDFGQVQNTGYFIAGKLFYPGDSYCDPGKKVDVLALPVAGPWCKISDSVRYALKLKPQKAFPVHDGMLQADKIGAYHKVPEIILEENGISFIPMNDGSEQEF